MHFKKTDMMRYISHLDLLRLFQRASRRANLPLCLTEGFNPHPRIKIEPAVKLGIEARGLCAEIILTEKIPDKDLMEALAKELPPGVEIIAAVEAVTNSDKSGCNATRRDMLSPIVSQEHQRVPRQGKDIWEKR